MKQSSYATKIIKCTQNLSVKSEKDAMTIGLIRYIFLAGTSIFCGMRIYNDIFTSTK